MTIVVLDWVRDIHLCSDAWSHCILLLGLITCCCGQLTDCLLDNTPPLMRHDYLLPGTSWSVGTPHPSTCLVVGHSQTYVLILNDQATMRQQILTVGWSEIYIVVPSYSLAQGGVTQFPSSCKLLERWIDLRAPFWTSPMWSWFLG